jgi:hypothetical protein
VTTVVSSPLAHSLSNESGGKQFRNQFNHKRTPRHLFPNIIGEDSSEERRSKGSSNDEQFFNEINPFTGYLAKVFLKLKEKRTSEQISEDLDKVRAIQLRTIKDLELCLVDYE